MILLWNSENYAKEYMLWTNLRGITHNQTRPNTVILMKKEYNEIVNTPGGEEYFSVLSRITLASNVIIVS